MMGMMDSLQPPWESQEPWEVELDELLGIDWNDPKARASWRMETNRYTIIEELTAAQDRIGMTDEEVAKKMQCTTWRFQQIKATPANSIVHIILWAMIIGQEIVITTKNVMTEEEDNV